MYNFSTFFEDNKSTHDFSCTMAMIENAQLEYFQNFIRKKISGRDLDKGGRDPETHCTILYGTHTSNVDDIKNVFSNTGITKIKMYMKGISTFPPGDDGLVLKVDVESEELDQLNEALSKLPNTNKFPKYSPHITLGYVKPETKEKYLSLTDPFKGNIIITSTIMFSNQIGEKITFDLNEL